MGTGSSAGTARISPASPATRPKRSSCPGCPPRCARWGWTTPRPPPG
ncbi:hypothetical protein NKH18_12250 [Streptomyces sp. M10(2022)]